MHRTRTLILDDEVGESTASAAYEPKASPTSTAQPDTLVRAGGRTLTSGNPPYGAPSRSIDDHNPDERDTLIAANRRHDLDALRGFAMVLGIGLHTALAFFPSFWPVQDQTVSIEGPFDELFHALHGFRMPLFFLLSGFFTAMLWRKRGLRALLRHRTRRVVLPLAILLVAIVPVARWVTEQAFTFGIDAVDSGHIQVSVMVGDGGLGLTWLDNIGHLWFLSFLVWLVAGFAVVTFAIERLDIRSGTARADVWQRWLMWSLIPFTVLGQRLMGNSGEIPVFGPDVSLGLIPLPHMLGYYGLFFAFGALLYDRHGRNGELLVDTLGRRWWIVLPVTIAIIFPVGLALTLAEDSRSWELASVTQVAYTWAMCIGLIGLFRSLFSRERRGVRYISDASYWMYLAHLPLVIAAQLLVRDWNMAASVKFLLICGAVSAILLAAYTAFVRYTPIGTLLNGARTRLRSPPVRGCPTLPEK